MVTLPINARSLAITVNGRDISLQSVRSSPKLQQSISCSFRRIFFRHFLLHLLFLPSCYTALSCLSPPHSRICSTNYSIYFTALGLIGKTNSSSFGTLIMEPQILTGNPRFKISKMSRYNRWKALMKTTSHTIPEISILKRNLPSISETLHCKTRHIFCSETQKHYGPINWPSHLRCFGSQPIKNSFKDCFDSQDITG